MDRNVRRPRIRIAIISVVGTVVGLIACARVADWRANAQRAAKFAEAESHRLGPQNPPSVASFFPRRVLPEQPVVTGYEIVSSREVRDAVRDDELVLAVEINGESRAYPINVMTGPQREIFNDTLGGRSIAATW